MAKDKIKITLEINVGVSRKQATDILIKVVNEIIEDIEDGILVESSTQTTRGRVVGDYTILHG